MTTMQAYLINYTDRHTAKTDCVVYHMAEPVQTWNEKQKFKEILTSHGQKLPEWVKNCQEFVSIQKIDLPKKRIKLWSEGKYGGKKEMIIETNMSFSSHHYFGSLAILNFIKEHKVTDEADCEEEILEFINFKKEFCKKFINSKQVVNNNSKIGVIVDTIVVPKECKTQYLFRWDGQEKVFGTHYPILKLLTGFNNRNIIEWKGSSTHFYESILTHDEIQENKDTSFMEFVRSNLKHADTGIRVSIYGKTFKQQTLMYQCREAFKKEQEIKNKIEILEKDIKKYKNEIEDLWKGDVVSFQTLYNCCIKGNVDEYSMYAPSRNIVEEVKNSLEEFLNVLLDSKQIETVKSSIIKIQKILDEGR